MSITRVENVPKIQLIVDLLTVRTGKHVYKSYLIQTSQT